MEAKKQSEIQEKFRITANKFIGWNSKYGLHISDGVDSCSGTDEIEEAKAKEYLIKLLNKAYQQGKGEVK